MGLHRNLLAAVFACGALLLGACDTAADTPEIVAGPASGVTGIAYEFTAVAPGEEPSAIQFDWGDGDTSAWSALVPGGDSVALSHAWDSTGAYDVKARARSEDGELTDWSDARRITIVPTWTTVLGGAEYDVVLAIAPTADGGYIATGYTLSYGAGNSDLWLIKTDASGDTAWTRTYGGVSDEYGNGVAQTSDGGYIIAGGTFSEGAGEQDVWLIKTDASGNETWTHTYGGPENEVANAVRQTPDGGYIIAGVTDSYGAGESDVYIVRTDASGDTAWTRVYGGVENDYGYSAWSTGDNGFVVGASTYSYGAGSADYWLIKLDASGDTAWTRTFGGTGYERGQSARPTPDGGYIVAGASSSFGGGDRDAWLVKTNASGDTAWTRTYGGTGTDWACLARPTEDGGYVFSGWTASSGAGQNDVWLVKLEADGDTVWTSTFGGTTQDYGYWVEETEDGGFVIAAETESFGAGESDAYIIKTDAAGDVGH